MKLNTWIPLGLAIVMGLAAAVVARGMLAGRKSRRAPPQVKVVVAKASVSPGSQIGADDVMLTAVSAEGRPDGSFADLSQVTGRVVTGQLVKGQVVLEALLASPGATAGLQNLVPEGMRLITVEVNEFSSLAGMLAPGCRVDILATLSDPDTKGMMARTIVENVKVQAVGQRLRAGRPGPGQPPEDPAGFRSVTLQVSPQEAESIHVATAAGRPWMVLRGPTDHAASRGPGVSLAELRGSGRRPEKKSADGVFAFVSAPKVPVVQKPAAPAKKQRTVTFIRGGKTETLLVDEPVAAPAAAAAAAPSHVITGGDQGPAVEQ